MRHSRDKNIKPPFLLLHLQFHEVPSPSLPSFKCNTSHRIFGHQQPANLQYRPVYYTDAIVLPPFLSICHVKVVLSFVGYTIVYYNIVCVHKKYCFLFDNIYFVVFVHSLQITSSEIVENTITKHR